MYRFLNKDEVVDEQRRQVGNYGGASGVIKPAQLDSAVAQPQASFDGQYMHVDVFEMAAAYLVSLCMGHAFADGNKRVALSTALKFLYVNGCVVKASTDEVVQLMHDVIGHKVDKHGAAAFFESHLDQEASTRVRAIEDSAKRLDEATSWVHATFVEAFKILAQ